MFLTYILCSPRQLPQVSSPRILKSLEEVQARLTELERTDDHNAQKLKRLEDKRKRKDERIAKRRTMEDEKIQMVIDARARKDERIRIRRQRENDAFRGADRQLEVEEVVSVIF
jgi:TolA-binding protein